METFRVRGTVRIYNRDKTVLYREYQNGFTNSGKNAMMHFLKGDFYIDGYSYLSIGEGREPFDLDETTLQMELFRKEFSSVEVRDNILILDTIIEPEEANFEWFELGLIVGGVSGQLNSGTLFNRVIIHEKKKKTEAITISWSIEIIST